MKFWVVFLSLILFFPALILVPLLAWAFAGIIGSILFWGIVLCLIFGLFVAFPILWQVFKLSISIIAKIILTIMFIAFFAIGLFLLAFVAIL